MRIGIYGGTFNPPHIGHVRAAAAAAEQLGLNRLLVIPAGIPPHKELEPGSPTNEERLEMVRLSFADLPCAEITDMELVRDGISFSINTVKELKRSCPGDDLFLIMGSDMYLTLENWRDADNLLSLVTPAVFSRGSAEDEKIGAYERDMNERLSVHTIIIEHKAVEVSSTQLRELLKRREGSEYLVDTAYEYIINKKLYGAKPEFDWLRVQAYTVLKTRRILHVAGCEAEAVRLARHWNADVNEAREAAILHDITKQFEHDDQLQLCRKYDIITDAVEAAEVKLLHAKTGAALARALYGASDAVHEAILWHTTGRADMSLLEKIVYIADYIEPTRVFENVKELRTLAYTDLDAAVARGLKMSVEDMRARGITPHDRSEEAYLWFTAHAPHFEGD